LCETTTTHADLVARAAHWLANTKRCSIVLVEAVAWSTSEQPDALGWDGRGNSLLVECKVSVADFVADRRKPFAANRMGSLRYYMTPPGLISVDDVPDGWGLLCAGKRVLVKREAVAATDTNLRGEVGHLVAELRRLLTGVRDPKTARCGIQLDRITKDSFAAYRRWVLNERAKENRAVRVSIQNALQKTK